MPFEQMYPNIVQTKKLLFSGLLSQDFMVFCRFWNIDNFSFKEKEMEEYPRLKYTLEMGLVWIEGEEYCMIDEDGIEATIGWINDPKTTESWLAWYLTKDI